MTASTPGGQSQATPAVSNVVLQPQPPTGDAEAMEVFNRARQGDAAAQARLRGLIRQRGWVDWIGDLGQLTTRMLTAFVTGGDAVWQAGVEEQVRSLTAELLGPNAGVLERLLVRRVVNGWVAVHALELEHAVRPPATLRGKEYLEGAIGRAQKRMTQAVVELARVRRLQAPLIVAKLTDTLPATDPLSGDSIPTRPTPAALRRMPAAVG